jgi:hypothetical protein
VSEERFAAMLAELHRIHNQAVEDLLTAQLILSEIELYVVAQRQRGNVIDPTHVLNLIK